MFLVKSSSTVLLKEKYPVYYGENPFSALASRAALALGIYDHQTYSKSLFDRTAEFVWENKNNIMDPSKRRIVQTNWSFYMDGKILDADPMYVFLRDQVASDISITLVGLKDKHSIFNQKYEIVPTRGDLLEALKTESLKATLVTTVKSMCKTFGVDNCISVPLSGASKGLLNDTIGVCVFAEILATLLPTPPGLIGSCIRTGYKGATATFIPFFLKNYTSISELEPMLRYSFLVFCFATFKAMFRFLCVFACGSDELGMILGSVAGELILYMLFARSNVKIVAIETKAE